MQKLLAEIWRSKLWSISWPRQLDKPCEYPSLFHFGCSLLFFFALIMYLTSFYGCCLLYLSCRYFLPPPFLSSLSSRLLSTLVLSSFSISNHHAPHLPLPPSLSPSLSLSSSDRLFMQAVCESILPSAVVELLLSSIVRISSSACQLQPDRVCRCRCA